MQRPNGLALLASACLAILPACTLPGDREPRPSSREWLDGLVVSDGISADEANRLADIYFDEVLRIGCGAVGPVTDEGGMWVAGTAVGALGLPGPPIVIDRRTGRITHEGAPTIEDPKTMWAEIERRRRDPLGNPEMPE